MHNKVSMFNKAHNINIKNSSVTVNADNSKLPEVLAQLFSKAAPNAILNADGRADEVRCYPGTREDVIGKVEKWMSSKGRRMMWLSGPAGAGKSAICQTVAERCRKRGQHEANFFFFRGDGIRNRSEPLVATLVYQLLEIYPALRRHLTDCLAAKPLIYNASVEDQFKHLVLSPIQAVQQPSSIHQTVVLIIDGLDECNDERKQEQILIALRTLADADHSPFLVLVASRAEHHLVMSFNRIGSSAESIFLDDEYRPQDDIRRFVVAKFDEVKTVHSLARTLSEDWPSSVNIDAITDKSSGQFIYAATVMRFIERSLDSPALSLRKILEMRPATGHSPYTQLDALYSYIFSKARDIRTLKLILCAYFIMDEHRQSLPGDLLHLVGYESMEVESFFADLASIIQVITRPHMRLVFYHASLSDYLRDESRSGPYHVNIPEIAAELSLVCLRSFHDSDTLSITVFVLAAVEEATETLSKSLLNASAQKLDKKLWSYVYWYMLIRIIGNLYFEKNEAMFKIILRHWIRFGYRNSITNFSQVDNDDLSPSSLKYYRWYLTVERAKLALRLTK